MALAIAPAGVVAVSLAIAALTHAEHGPSRGTKVLSALAIGQSAAGAALLVDE